MIVNHLLQVERNPLSSLWELDAIGITDPAQREDKKKLENETQALFDKTVTQLTDGRYQVSLPWLTGAQKNLTSNYYAASSRLLSTTNYLQIKGHLEKYDQLFRTWEAQDMIEEVPKEEIYSFGHYLPHRAVVKLSSATTPIRPVFNGSSKAKGKLSLNDCLDKGPNTLELIPPILTRFRLHKVGVIADIEKAFQQISIQPSDRDFMRFLWSSDSNCNQKKVYRHKRVVFGVTSSPYLLGATVRHHLQKATGREADVAKLLLQSMYVDNTILSLDTLKEAIEFKNVAVSLLKSAMFSLRSWEFGLEDESPCSAVLGLIWNKRDDNILLDVTKVSQKIEMEPTIRHLLGLVHGIFDPLGLASPFTLLGKILLQRCHEDKTGLDGQLKPKLRADVLNWASQIPQLAKLTVSRHVHFGEAGQYSLHLMCDASSVATAAAVYLRWEKDGRVEVYLIASKGRVAPKGKVTIPRLELVACVIGARLLNTVIHDIGNPEIQVFLWSDSSTALTWIKCIGPWGVFVSNCVQKIKLVTSIVDWRHIPGKNNIADLPSRGCSAKKLLESKWWNGPDWLRLPANEWPTSNEVADVNLVENEKRKTVINVFTSSCKHPILNFLRTSSYFVILRSIAVWLYYKKKLQLKCHIESQPTAVIEVIRKPYLSKCQLDTAEFHLLLFIQQSLHDDPDRLNKLNPFVDSRGLLRVRTRLTNEEEDFKYPIVLPDKDEFVRRMIYWEHEKNCHVGATTLLSILRERFWIINGRRTVRGVITRCWICRRFSTRRLSAPQPPLPSSRTCVGSPFSVTGIDAAGPLYLKGGEKVWILLLTCATYRAVHIELVDTLSADGVIRALRRFISRRGRPSIIYSDNALGFVAANKFLNRADFDKIVEYATVDKLEWRFNPPLAPWWGGWWERLIGLAKQLIRRILGKRVVGRSELDTLLCEVEDCLNNRPLTYTSENVDDPVPLTPNHFVRGSGLMYFPEADVHDSMATRSTYRRLQSLREALRSRFRKEYLGFLRGQAASKVSGQLKVGDVVIVESENQKRLDWPLAVVVEGIPGRDGITRLFRVKARSGEMLRPVQRLFPMEQQEAGN